MQCTIQTVETFPESSQPLLEMSSNAWRTISNLNTVMVESPQADQDLHRRCTPTTLTAEERSVIRLNDSGANQCHDGVPSQTAMDHMEGLEHSLIAALRSGDSRADSQ